MSIPFHSISFILLFLFSDKSNIEFDPSLAGETIVLTSGLLEITDNTVITGLGADNLTIDAQGNSGVFDVDDGDFYSQITVGISGLTITGSSNYQVGIENDENLTISNSTISGNSEGGIRNSGELTISNSTISGNSGSGINNSGELTISNSTISGNSSNSSGGGIRNSGDLTISNSTITLNQGSEGSGLASYAGPYSNSEITISNTIISGNLGSDVDLVSYSPNPTTNNITSNGGNLIGTGNAVEAFDQPGDTIGVTRPGLEPLADNGGPTATHALEADSPAVNNGIDSLIPPGITTDQRGEARVVGPQVDIGAVESDFLEVPIATVALLVSNPAATTEGGSEASYRLTRTGTTDNALGVFLQVSPSLGLTESDFTLSGVTGTFPNYTATIPAGESFIDLIVTAVEDGVTESAEFLTLDFVSDPSYRIGSEGGVVAIVPETLLVTNTNDSGDGSLRSALELANLAPDQNQIEFDPSLAGETISLTSGALAISSAVAINGLGADQLTVDAQGNSQVFNVANNSSDNSVAASLSGLTITGGVDGGIYNRGILTITDAIISGNTTNVSFERPLGGGIFNSGDLSITNSTISNNAALPLSSYDNYGGGGIYNQGNLTITNSTISDNTGVRSGGIDNKNLATDDDTVVNIINTTISDNTSLDSRGGGIYGNGVELNITNSTISGNSGGGIYNKYGSNMTITDSTIYNNSTEERGGGINNSYAEMTIINSTISGNVAEESGGGIFSGSNGFLTINNSTITLNQAPEGGGFTSYIEVYRISDIAIANTIITGNTTTDVDLAFYEDVLPNNINSLGGNLIGIGTGTDAFNQPTDQTEVTDPGLEPLADNGGPTLTHALQDDSPALNAGDSNLIPEGVTTDQRGEPFVRIFEDVVDIGAFELQDIPTNTINGTPGRDTLDGTSAPDLITGFQSRDLLTGGGDSDQFIFTSVLDGIDIITDFEVNTDQIVLNAVLNSLNYTGSDPIADNYVTFVAQGSDTLLKLDPDGNGDAQARPFILVQGLSPSSLNNPDNFIFA